MGDYKKLRVWQSACELADEVERLAHQLPNHVRERAFNQLVPAAHGIHENIAEGCGYDSDPQLAKYLRQALATANETEDELLALQRQDLLGDFDQLPDKTRSLCAMLAVFKRKVETAVAIQRGKKPSRRPRAESRSREPQAETESRGLAPTAKSQEPSG